VVPGRHESACPSGRSDGQNIERVNAEMGSAVVAVCALTIRAHGNLSGVWRGRPTVEPALRPILLGHQGTIDVFRWTLDICPRLNKPGRTSVALRSWNPCILPGQIGRRYWGRSVEVFHVTGVNLPQLATLPLFQASETHNANQVRK
jgi:hypothetical protein